MSNLSTTLKLLELLVESLEAGDAPVFPGGPVKGLDLSVNLVDATGVAWGTVGNPIITTGAGGGGASNVQGVVGSGVSIVGINPLIMGVADGSNLARFLLAAAAAGDASSGANSFISATIGWNGSFWDRIRTTPGATGTTGTGILSSGPLLWDAVNQVNFVKQAGDASGRAMVVGSATASTLASNNLLVQAGVDSGGNVQPAATEATQLDSRRLLEQMLIEMRMLRTTFDIVYGLKQVGLTAGWDGRFGDGGIA